MASVENDNQGFRVRFQDLQKKRQTIRLSRLNQKQAEQVARHVEELLNWKRSGLTLNPATAKWIGGLTQEMHDKLSRTGLIEPRNHSPLSVFLAGYINAGLTADDRPAAPSTLSKWRQAEKVLVRFFADRDISGITHDDARAFRQYLDGTALGENGKRSHIACAKMFFNAAIRRKLVTENPFEFQKASLVINRTRDFYVSRQMMLQIIDAAPDGQWRLMLALWRFAGLRKMEIFHLRWEHVLWDSGRMLVTSPKTAHHSGKESRFVPIAGVRKWLEAEFEKPGEDPRVIDRYTKPNANLAKPLERILTLAGFVAWPKLIQNLRASCETDWLDSGMPAHVVAKWIGHTVKVQNDNYAQVDEHHFQRFNAIETANLPLRQDTPDQPGAQVGAAESGTGKN